MRLLKYFPGIIRRGGHISANMDEEYQQNGQAANGIKNRDMMFRLLHGSQRNKQRGLAPRLVFRRNI